MPGNASGADKGWVHRAHADADTSPELGEAALSRWTRSRRLRGDLSQRKRVRYLVIGVWGANYYAPSGSAMFTTLDRDLFLPSDPWESARLLGVCAGTTALICSPERSRLTNRH